MCVNTAGTGLADFYVDRLTGDLIITNNLAFDWTAIQGTQAARTNAAAFYEPNTAGGGFALKLVTRAGPTVTVMDVPGGTLASTGPLTLDRTITLQNYGAMVYSLNEATNSVAWARVAVLQNVEYDASGRVVSAGPALLLTAAYDTSDATYIMLVSGTGTDELQEL